MLKDLPAGKNPPDQINVVIEIPAGSSIKYEVDEDSGAIFVDRFLYTAMNYPFNYGFVPSTAAEDKDPVDVLVLSSHPVAPGSVFKAQPIGMLEMEDEEGIDTKIVAVPVAKVDPIFGAYTTIDQLPQLYKDQIKHFFEHYKDLEPGKWVKVTGWQSADKAKQSITQAIERFNNKT
ncbi:MAG: inorganic diphosphatase [bacterium]|nr:inorganic diphosphatase [bacterium]